MRTPILDPAPAQLQDLLERRRRDGADRHDEVWQGVHHMVSAPGGAHSLIAQQLSCLTPPPARPASWSASTSTSAPSTTTACPTSHHRGRPRGTWIPTAAAAVEILSPEDETWDKLPFYAEHHVDELIVVAPSAHSVDWRA